MQDNVRYFFTQEKTETFINFCKKYKLRIGYRKLWKVVARDLSNIHKITIHPVKCENKGKVLKKSCKKLIENNQQSGRIIDI